MKIILKIASLYLPYTIKSTSRRILLYLFVTGATLIAVSCSDQRSSNANGPGLQGASEPGLPEVDPITDTVNQHL